MTTNQLNFQTTIRTNLNTILYDKDTFSKKYSEISGIYVVANIENSGLYIGRSANVKERVRQHSSGLNSKIHKNDKLLQEWSNNTFQYGLL